jgi:carbamoyltransferase
MITLGLHDGHNASAALLRDGELVSAAQEERFTRVKNQGGMPSRAIDSILGAADIERKDVDLFAISDRYHFDLRWDRESVLRLFGGRGQTVPRIIVGHNPAIREFRSNQLLRRRRGSLSALGLPPDRTEIVEHHEAHASAAYFGYGVYDEPVLVLTADGVGDFVCASVNIGKGGRLERVAAVADLHSLGTLYAKVTLLMGMVPLEHEHKVMGLAPYGAKSTKDAQRIKQKFLDLFDFDANGLTWTSTDRSKTMAGSLDFLKKIIDRERFDCLAAGLQLFLEDMLVTWVENCVRHTGISNVALGGGVFMNVKANKRILECPAVNSLFVMPSCGDETNSIGAGYAACAGRSRTHGTPSVVRLDHLYLGEEITDAQAEMALKSLHPDGDVRWQRFADPEAETARLLAAGHVVARAAGRMEFGARSLGNRSILADPSVPGVATLINDMIKDRDFWMPFAPSVLAERSEEYFSKPKPIPAPYMVLTFDARPEKWAVLRAACHPTDHTIRPQEVDRARNPQYHRLLTHFSQLRGEAVVLNTSFNLHGFPIVRTAEDALDVFRRSGLEYMQLAGFLVWKEPAVAAGEQHEVEHAARPAQVQTQSG